MYPAILFVTRKYPPSRGGMEEFSRQVFEAYPGRKQLVALTRGQRWLPEFLLRALMHARVDGPSFDVVHLGDGMLAPLAPAIRALSATPVAVTVHGQEVTRDLPLYRDAVGAALRDSRTHVVAVSAFTAGEVRRRHRVRDVAVIANGIDVERFGGLGRSPDTRAQRLRLGLPLEGPLIVSVGRLVRRKGALWFVDNVLRDLPPGVTFAVAGDGPDAGVLAVRAGSEARLHLLGPVRDAVVDQLYSCADLFIAPNIVVKGKPEGYGIAPAEAAAAGLPVLVSDVEGLHDMAATVGIPTVRGGDASAWVAAVRAALARPDSARATIPPRGWDGVALDYARYFERIVGREATRARRRPETA